MSVWGFIGLVWMESFVRHSCPMVVEYLLWSWLQWPWRIRSGWCASLAFLVGGTGGMSVRAAIVLARWGCPLTSSSGSHEGSKVTRCVLVTRRYSWVVSVGFGGADVLRLGRGLGGLVQYWVQSGHCQVGGRGKEGLAGRHVGWYAL